MKIERREDREREAIEAWRKRISAHRDGRHVTDAIRCSGVSFGIGRMKMAGRELHYDDQSVLRMSEGMFIAASIEADYVSQIEAVCAEDDSVVTLDIWTGKFPAEIKITSRSSRRDVGEMDRAILQLSEQTYRGMKPGAKQGYGELRIWHRRADYQKKFCADHGVPNGTAPKKVFPGTGRPRMVCPTCQEFLEDSGDTIHYRVHGLTWSRAELEANHKMIIWRLAEIDRQIADVSYQPGNMPPILWGSPEQCDTCPIKEAWGCAGFGNEQDLEANLSGSILEMRKEKATA